MEDINSSKKKRRTHRAHLSAGMERTLCIAATDRAFCEALFEDRVAAVQQRGIVLSDSELAMLRAIPEAQLRAAIDGVDVSEDNLRRRSFLRAVAVSAAALSVGQPWGTCAGDARAESRAPPKDWGVPKDVPPTYPDMGMRPPDQGQDIPLVTTDGGGPDMGIRPKDIAVDIDVNAPRVDAGVRRDDQYVDDAARTGDDSDDDGGGCNMAP